MSVLYDFFSANLPIVYFLYGLVFFLMGFAIFFQNRKVSMIPLAKHLWLLACFGIAHGFSEWAVTFIPIQAEHLSGNAVLSLRYIHTFVTALSFTFLLQFGINLVNKATHTWLFRLPILLFCFWLLHFAVVSFSNKVHDVRHLLYCETLARYFLAMPGAILTGYGLLKHKEQIQFLNQRLVNNLLGAAIAFFAYAVAAGFFVPRYDFFPASKFNSDIFFQVTGLPVAVFRGACGLVGAYFIIRALEIFDWEYNRRLEEAEKNQAVLLDRERIARDLHDGIIQSIYAVGLNLENTRYLVQENPEVAEKEILSNMEKLNNIIIDLRNCILNLHPAQLTESEFQKSIIILINEFKRNTGITTDFSVVRETGERPPQGSLRHIYFIVNEALNNIAKHANASQAKVHFCFKPDYMELGISDNGKGFLFKSFTKCQHGHQGLRNIYERVAGLKGSVSIDTAEGEGTLLRVRIPYGEKHYDKNHAG